MAIRDALMRGAVGVATACGAAWLAGCVATPQPQTVQPLRVGVDPEYPPLIFRQGDVTVGVEADLAARLAQDLGRPLELVELPRDGLMRSLEKGTVDIVTSGIDVAPARGRRVALCDPYLRTGLVAIIPVGDRAKYSAVSDLLARASRIAVVRGSAADAFVERNCAGARRVYLRKGEDALYFFDGKRMDAFVGDVHALAWLVSRNETLVGYWQPLTDEWVAWAVRAEDSSLKQAVNAILARWKADGSLDGVLDRWLPDRERIQWPNEKQGTRNEEQRTVNQEEGGSR